MRRNRLLKPASGPILSLAIDFRRSLDADAGVVEQPQDNQNDEDQAKYAAKACPAIAAMGVITAAAAKQKDQNNDEKK
jgi:hypothetical protein